MDHPGQLSQRKWFEESQNSVNTQAIKADEGLRRLSGQTLPEASNFEPEPHTPEP
jgi:hypothetical protein